MRDAIRCIAALVFLFALAGCGGGGGNHVPDTNSDNAGMNNEGGMRVRRECRAYTPFRIPADYLLPSSQRATRINSVMVFNRPEFAVIRDGMTLTIQHHPDAAAKTEHDHINWNEVHRLRDAVQAGDILKILKADPRHSFVKGDKQNYEFFEAGEEYRVLADNTMQWDNAYPGAPEGHKSENRYLALEEENNAAVCGTTSGEKFVVPVDGDGKFVGNGGFLLRDDMRDLRTEEFSFAAGGFLFAADSDLQRAHIARSFTSPQFGGLQLQADGGYKILREEETSFVYRRARLSWSNSSRAKLYAQFANGAVRSDGTYQNARLRGFVFGVFYEGLFRRNDSYHAKIERPLADESLNLSRFAAAAVFGEEEEYVRINFTHRLQNNQTAFRLFYHLQL